MTEEELIEYVQDRIYTNNSFSTSSLDIQESIVQVIKELYNKDNSTTPTLQQVLDTGNTADLELIANMILTRVSSGEQNIISPDAITLVRDNDTVNSVSFLTNHTPLQHSKSFKGTDDSTSFFESGIGASYNAQLNDTQGFTGNQNTLLDLLGKSYSVTGVNGEFIDERINQESATSEGTNSNGDTFKGDISNDSFELSGNKVDGSASYTITGVNGTSVPNGTMPILLSTKANPTLVPLSTLSIDGDLQIADVETEETPIEALTIDSDGVVKKTTLSNLSSDLGLYEVLNNGNVSNNGFPLVLSDDNGAIVLTPYSLSLPTFNVGGGDMIYQGASSSHQTEFTQSSFVSSRVSVGALPDYSVGYNMGVGQGFYISTDYNGSKSTPATALMDIDGDLRVRNVSVNNNNMPSLKIDDDGYVYKSYTSYETELLQGADSFSPTLKKNYTIGDVVTQGQDIDINLPEVLNDSHLGKWHFFNENTVQNKGALKFNHSSFLVPPLTVPESLSATLECIKFTTTGGGDYYKFIVLGIE